MRIPLSWLKDFIDIELPPQQIAKTLTMLGLEVDAIHTTGAAFTNVVVVKVIQVQKHPNADSLTVATVFDGSEQFQVVCGAPNCREGIKTAFAKIGAVLPDGDSTFKVKKAALKGVESHGMLCSAKELQIGLSDDGIIEFEAHIPEGTDVATLYADSVFEISLTPNLGHCVSVYGVARELAASLELPLKDPWEYAATGSPSSAGVTIQNPSKCPRYTCCTVKGIKVAPSPEWIQLRLIACGLRPVNNIVDITNYILLGMGQPLHAFDKSKLLGNTIHVRSAIEGQTFTALDGSCHILSDGDIIICDEKNILALGGVMGGEHSKVTDDTTDILLESACFEPASIRRTSRRLGLMSDSSYRFEKGIDIANVDKALRYAARLIENIAGGSVEEKITDAYPGKKNALQLKCRLGKIHQLLGLSISSGEVESIFSRLGMKTHFDAHQECYTVEIPSWRNDIKEEIDLIEEVARLYGYENFPRQQSSYAASSLPDTPLYTFENEVRSRLVSEGLQEFLCCDLISPQQAEQALNKIAPKDTLVQVLNPCSIEQSVLRPSFLPGLLQVVKYNIDHQTRDINAFEIGRVHFKEGEKYYDQSTVGIILTGACKPHNWLDKEQDADFYILKGIVENLLTGLRIPPVTLSNRNLSTLHPGRQAAVFIGENELGAFGEVHPDLLRYYDISQRVYFAEFNLHNLLIVRGPEPVSQPLSIYPHSERDWTLTVDEKIPVGYIVHLAKTLPSRLLKSVSLLDIYVGDRAGPTKKNVTLRCNYRDDNKTVSQQAVDSEHDRLIRHVTQALSK